MHKLLSLLLCLIIILMMPIPSLAEDIEVVEAPDEALIDETLLDEDSFEITSSRASKSTYALPKQLKTIGPEAFLGDETLQRVTMSSNVTSIGQKAFAKCSNLEYIYIPSSVTYIGGDAFMGTKADLYIKTGAGSAAMTYALNNNIDVNAGTVYRALLIGNDYSTSEQRTLNGPLNDVDAMATCLGNLTVTNYQVTKRKNCSAVGLAAAVRSTFGSARKQDVSLFYFSGHGGYLGSTPIIVAQDDQLIGVPYLRSLFDEIPGKKIIIFDTCNSGAMIGRGLGDADEEEEEGGFDDDVIQIFSRKERGNLAADNYFVLTSSTGDQNSLDGWFGGAFRGQFTYYLIQAWGYNGSKFISKKADANANGCVTLKETAVWINSKIEEQTVRTYPTNCTWFGLARY